MKCSHIVLGLSVSLLLGSCKRTTIKEIVDKFALSQESAEQLLREDPSTGLNRGKATCSVGISRKVAGEPYISILSADTKCYENLKKVGLITFGRCFEDIHGTCFEEEVVGTGTTHIINKRLVFDCGTLDFIGVKSVVVEGGKATIFYEQKVTTDDTLMSMLGKCDDLRIEGKGGSKAQERSFIRDGSGKWQRIRQHPYSASDNCWTCYSRNCEQQETECNNSRECVLIRDCVKDCFDQTCVDDCFGKYQDGKRAARIRYDCRNTYCGRVCPFVTPTNRETVDEIVEAVMNGTYKNK